MNSCKVLLIYPNAHGFSRIPLGMSIISTCLKQAGHQVRLFDTTFDKSTNLDNAWREKLGIVKKVEIDFLHTIKSEKAIEDALVKLLKGYSPDLILFSIVEQNLAYATQIMRVIKENYGGIIAAGGVTPTAIPDIIIKNPYVDIVCLGEGEEVAVELANTIGAGQSFDYIKNLWVKKANGAIIQNPMRPFIDMDKLPIQDVGIFDDRHLAKPFDGRIVRTTGVEMSRGCPNKCHFCANERAQQMLASCGTYHREKSIEKSVEEMRVLKDEFKLDMMFFNDENFLMMSEKRFNDFYKMYKKEVGIPFYIQTRVETVTDYKAKKLKELDCATVGMGVESGSEKLRKTVLNRYMTNQQIIDGFCKIHSVGIRTTSNNMLGFPTETKRDILDTIKINKIIQPKSLELCYLVPYAGTRLHDLCVVLKLIPDGLVQNLSLREQTVLNFPKSHKKFLEKVFSNFSKYVSGELELPN